MTAPVIIDQQALENLRELNPGDNDAFVREIRDIFFQDTPQRLAELEECLASGDAVKFSRTAHSIKGSSTNLGAIGVRDVAEKLEAESKTKPVSSLVDLVESLKMEYARAKAEILRLVP
ncbi:MAG: Hpt protein [Verrucomicrobia bacterium]|nr:Hpt protein [Verrucomicrobiota bacterium]